MAGEFTKSTSIKPAVIGTIANPDEYNQNIAGQSKGSILPIDVDGNFADGDLGNESIITNGALISNLKLRNTAQITTYDASGVLDETINFGQATESALGTTEIATQAEVDAGTDNQRTITPAKLLGLFNASSQSSNGYVRLPINISGAFDEIIIQWGLYNGTGNQISVNFPITFPNACLGVSFSAYDINSQAVNASAEAGKIVSASQIQFGVPTDANGLYWIAIGY